MRTSSDIETFEQSKRGPHHPSGDSVFISDSFLAIVDGATPKGDHLWGPNQLRGDVYVANVLKAAIAALKPKVQAREAIATLNQAIADAYLSEGIDLATLPSVERLQASVIIYSTTRHEIWSFGDCRARVNGKNYLNVKAVDEVLSSLRALYVELHQCDDPSYDPGNDPDDYGRQMILPLLKEQAKLANESGAFGFDVLDGGNIHPEHVRIFAVQRGDRVVLASDGYPKLFDTLEECEAYLKRALEEDPGCVGLLCGTKSLSPENCSYDDRSFIGFDVQ